MVDPVGRGPVANGYLMAVRGTAPRQATVDRPASVPRDVSGSAQPGRVLARLVDRAVALTNAGPPVDDAKVAQVRRAIAEDSYRVDVNALAKAIVQFGIVE